MEMEALTNRFQFQLQYLDSRRISRKIVQMSQNANCLCLESMSYMYVNTFNNVFCCNPHFQPPESSKLTVYCMRGGWTVIQSRGQFGNPKDFFYKPWTDYELGFGTPGHYNFISAKSWSQLNECIFSQYRKRILGRLERHLQSYQGPKHGAEDYHGKV